MVIMQHSAGLYLHLHVRNTLVIYILSRFVEYKGFSLPQANVKAAFHRSASYLHANMHTDLEGRGGQQLVTFCFCVVRF